MRSDAAVLAGEIGSRTGRSILWRSGRTRSTESLAVTEESTAVALVAAAAIAECAAVAGAITPVPGGVGPMTIACLLDNTVKAAVTRRGHPTL